MFQVNVWGVLLGKNRDRLSIVVAILEAAHFSASKTRIMYAANLSFSLLEKYLEVASGAGLIKVSRGKYLLTLKGQGFLREYNYFHQRYDRAQKMLESLGSEREQLESLCNRIA